MGILEDIKQSGADKFLSDIDGLLIRAVSASAG